MGKEKCISVHNVSKTYKILKRKGNFIKRIFSNEYEIKNAVKDISFDIYEGEIVGFLGPNGAGKSTTIKMLCGILKSSDGTIRVLNKDPFEGRKKNAFFVGAVFGQRSQLWWDLPVKDTFYMLKQLYKISNKDFKERIDFFNQYLDISHIWEQPVRQLSLGQRMRVEVAVAIIHNPKILYLDEPTIGLDIIAKKQIRNFIKELNNKYHTTIVLTSHDMQDIEMLCNRILVINCGKIVVDEEVKTLKHMYNQDIKIKIDFNEPVTLKKLAIENLTCECIDKKGYIWEFTLLNNTQELTKCLNKIVSIGTIEKIEILEKNVEEIISEIYDKEI